MVRPQVADRGDALQVGRVAANIMNVQRTDDRGGRGAVRLSMGTTIVKYLPIVNFKFK
jgi:hypothetical protein